MTYSAHSTPCDPFGDVSDGALLAALKQQMEGLATLFSGLAQDTAQKPKPQDDFVFDSAFDALPV